MKRNKDKMASTPVTPGTEILRVQNSFFNMDTFDSVTVVKDVPYQKVSSVDDAVSRLNGDSAKLLEALDEGMKVFARRDARATSDGWNIKNDDGTVGSSYTPQGGPIDEKVVNSAVLNFAKTIYGPIYATDKSKAKEMAKDLIKSNPAILEGLKASAALPANSEE